MKTKIKPRIVVSQCLEFDTCRYNGAKIPEKFVRRLTRYVDFIQVCPEVEIGLGVPRDPIRLVKKQKTISLVQPSTGKDVTVAMNRFASSYLASLKGVDGFILKSSSPSCGVKNVKVFNASDSPIPMEKDLGLFTRHAFEHFNGIAIEDEGRLTNFKVREHFLTRIFAFARFRLAQESGEVASLVDFHSEHKLLLMVYNQQSMRALGKIVAGVHKENIAEAYAAYFIELKHAFRKNARYTSHINVLMHALGYFKKELTGKEKKYFLHCLEKYREERIPLSALLSILQAWIIKYEKKYLERQRYFNPYPLELVEITDSGKGRDGRY